jgi:hypothetical protein
MSANKIFAVVVRTEMPVCATDECDAEKIARKHVRDAHFSFDAYEAIDDFDKDVCPWGGDGKTIGEILAAQAEREKEAEAKADGGSNG